MRLFRIFDRGTLIEERQAGYDETAIELQHDLSRDRPWIKVETIVLPDPPKRERYYEEDEE